MSTLPCTPCKVSVSNLPSGGKMKWALKGIWAFILWWGGKKRKEDFTKESSELHVACGEKGVGRKQGENRGGWVFLFHRTNVSCEPDENHIFKFLVSEEEDLSPGNKVLFLICRILWKRLKSAFTNCVSMIYVSISAAPIQIFPFVNVEESMKGEWRGNLLPGTLSAFMSVFHIVRGYNSFKPLELQ